MRGEVSELTIEGKDYLFVSDRENSTAEIIETEKGFSHSYYDNSRGRGFISSYRWDRTKRVFIFVEEDEPSGQSLSDILAAYRIPRSLGLFAMSVSYEE